MERDGSAFSVMLIRVDEYERLERNTEAWHVALQRGCCSSGCEDAVALGITSSCFSVLLPRTPLSELLASPNEYGARHTMPDPDGKGLRSKSP